MMAPATSRPGGRLPASIPLRLPASFGDKPGLMIRKSITWRIARRARRLKKVRRNHGSTRSPKAERTRVERRERDGRPDDADAMAYSRPKIIFRVPMWGAAPTELP